MPALYFERRRIATMMYNYYCNIVARFYDKLYSDDSVDVWSVNRKIKRFQKKASKVKKHIKCLDRRYLSSL